MPNEVDGTVAVAAKPSPKNKAPKLPTSSKKRKAETPHAYPPPLLFVLSPQINFHGENSFKKWRNLAELFRIVEDVIESIRSIRRFPCKWRTAPRIVGFIVGIPLKPPN